ncbi:MAG TPA: DUF89 family protein [Thermoplasmata archaeon]|nr:DUF89 family protein [Thermoplasmata archaeon]
MRMSPECVPCLIRRVLFETMEVDPSKSVETVKYASAALGRLFGDDVCSATVATEVHKGVYDRLGDGDPYKELKAKSNEVALELYPSAERLVARSTDKLKTSFLCAVVGNVMDFGIGTGFDHPASLKKEFKNLLDEGLGHDDTPKVRKLLKKGADVAYLVDNCGEIVFDRLVLKELKKLGARVTLVLKEEPILTDVTKMDIDGLGLEKLVDEIVEAPGFAVGIDLPSMDGDFGDMLREKDLVIAKGMANFESLSETDLAPIAYLLRTKCAPVAHNIGLKKDINAVKLLQRGRRTR